MGHYAAEMSCPKCGKIRCTCPVVKEKKGDWVIEPKTYKAIRADKLIEKMKTRKDGDDTLSYLFRQSQADNNVYWLPHYFSKKGAEEAGRLQYESDVKHYKDTLSKVEKRIRGTVTTMEKLKMYEGLLHDIQMFAEVTMDEKKLKKLIGNICAWSYAHRCGNGENSEQEQQAIIDNAFKKLRER